MTLVAPGVAVASLVVREEQGLTKGLPTLPALTGLLLTVNPLVSVQVRAAPEVLPAVDTEKRLLSSMDSEMLQKACVLAEHFPTLLAPIRFLAKMDFLMSDKV